MYDLFIVYRGGRGKIIVNVTDYGINSQGQYYFVKNGYRNFVPADVVEYFGRKFDWEEK